MMGYTVAINSVFAIMIAATYLFGNVKSGTADSTFFTESSVLHYYHTDHYGDTDEDDVCRRKYNGCRRCTFKN